MRGSTFLIRAMVAELVMIPAVDCELAATAALGGVAATTITSRLRVEVAERVMSMVADSGAAATTASSHLLAVVAGEEIALDFYAGVEATVADGGVRTMVAGNNCRWSTVTERVVIRSPDYNFAMVDTTNDLKAHDVSGLTHQNLFNTHDHYKVSGSTNNKQNPLVKLASAIIAPYYMKMKDESKMDTNAWHSVWDQRLDEEHVKYVAKDGCTSYKMYRRIIDMRKCLRHALDEGSSHTE
ncbi:putative ubiquitin-conjugating enzyme E2 26 [Hordeum vulgare]|nr:putative ubiquitin-conjugating enzyme E2 26 [Hordeum vulgare]